MQARLFASWLTSAALMLGTAAAASGAVIGPYTPDAHTLHLWHFDEASGDFQDSVATNPFHLTNTGGPTGRGPSGSGGYGGAAYAGFGSSFNVLGSGNGNWNSVQTSSGGGALTGVEVPQSGLQGANGAYTWEALVYVGGAFTAAGEYTILSRDGALNGAAAPRGPTFRVLVDAQGNRNLNWYNGGVGVAMQALLPTTGEHAFTQGEWFHVAATYNGNEGEANNFNFYWTNLNSDVTEANLLATLTQTADAPSTSNLFGVGGMTRQPYRFEWAGLIDEVRISSIARGADDFLFAAAADPVPEPSTWALFGSMGVAVVFYVRRRRR